jgi:hypothetical protein
MTLQPLPSEFPYIWGKLYFIFLSVHKPLCLPLALSVCLPVCLSVLFPLFYSETYCILSTHSGSPEPGRGSWHRLVSRKQLHGHSPTSTAVTLHVNCICSIGVDIVALRGIPANFTKKYPWTGLYVECTILFYQFSDRLHAKDKWNSSRCQSSYQGY